MIKKNVRIKAFEYLMKIKDSHSKTRKLAYSDLSLQEYLQPSSPLSIMEKQFFFSARCRMIDIRCNFKNGNSDLMCRKCRKEPESQQHILQCPEIIKTPNNIEYDDLFKKDLDKLIAAGKLLMLCFNLVINMPNVHNSALRRVGAATL